MARELGVNDTTLGFWVKEYRKKLDGQPLPPGMPDQERIRELERRNRELEMELAFLKKPRRTSRGSNGDRALRVH